MKIVILSAANNVHTERWVNGLSEKGIEVFLISIHPCTITLNKNVKFFKLPYLKATGYIFSVFKLRKILLKIKPDLLNAHYATGYGLLAKLSNFHPVMISVWGSDVYLFPKKSSFHKSLLIQNLKHADSIGSTSNCMKDELMKYIIHPKIFITPFGINEQKFKPIKSLNSHNDKIVIGTVKSLKNVYGIDILIKAFAEVLAIYPERNNLKLEIYGKGNQLKELEDLVEKLNLSKQVVFHGQINHDRVPEVLNTFDIYVALSRSESFGVAILEASACGIPVIVSNTAGLVEVVKENETGLIVPVEDIQSSKSAIMNLINNLSLRLELGKNGIKHVKDNYTWEQSLKIMIEAYVKTINNKN